MIEGGRDEPGQWYLKRPIREDWEADDLRATMETHERMREAGIAVVSYVVKTDADGDRYIRAEEVTGVPLHESDALPTSVRHAALGQLAVGWHNFFSKAITQQYPYFLGDTTRLAQYVYGTSESYQNPTPIMVDVDPFPVDLSVAVDKIESPEALNLNDELRKLKAWAGPYWREQNLTFPLPIYEPKEFIIMQCEAAGVPQKILDRMRQNT